MARLIPLWRSGNPDVQCRNHCGLEAFAICKQNNKLYPKVDPENTNPRKVYFKHEKIEVPLSLWQ